jgi:hypothetical protein
MCSLETYRDTAYIGANWVCPLLVITWADLLYYLYMYTIANLPT